MPHIFVCWGGGGYFIKILSVLILSISVCVFATASNAKTISVMQYNVENLFDTVQDGPNDTEFTPDGTSHWTPQKLAAKLQQLGKVIKSIKNTDGSSCPDVLSMTEVENINVLTMLRDQALQDCQYTKMILDPKDPDPRGIKVAMLTRLDLVDKPISHPTYRGGRFIQEDHLTVDGHPFIVFVNHWKSRFSRPPETGDGSEKRIIDADILHKRMAEIAQGNPDIPMIAMGDFNDDFEDQSISTHLDATGNPQAVADSAENPKLWETAFDILNREPFKSMDPSEQTPAWKLARFTYYFSGTKSFNDFDHILLSRGFFTGQGLSFLPNSFEVVKTKDNMRPRSHTPLPFTVKLDDDGNVTAAAGASDHFPVLIRLQVGDEQ